MIDHMLQTLAQFPLPVLAQTEATPAIIEKLRFVVPEIAVFIGACVVMMLGLSRKYAVRHACRHVAIATLAVAGVLAVFFSPVMETSLLPNLSGFMKVMVAVIGILLAMLLNGVVDRGYESTVSKGATFDAIRSTGGEFYAFFLFSLMGLMLCATADDLIWLFLALELTSLPTYVMVSISGGSAKGEARAQEAGVKYFFLGAFGAAMFVMGFALLYGAAGTTTLFGEGSISEVLARNIAETGSIGPIATLGAVFAIVGISFKIAAVPMHFYTADVYQGAATPVSAFLAFVPKAAGFIALMLIVSTLGWSFGSDAGGALVADHSGSLPEPIRVLLWVMAALTMIVGNVMALLQRSVKRILAYSSIAHSGYMLVGLIAGPGNGTSGLSAVLFYLLCYGVMNLGAFGVIACLEYDKDGHQEEVEDIDDLRGLCRSRPLLGLTMVICSLSLLGLPLLLGFMGKLFLFASGISAGEIVLVVIMAINSAIAAYYYLRLAFFPMLESRSEDAEPMQTSPYTSRKVASVISAVGVLALIPLTQTLWSHADHAGTYTGIATPAVVEQPSGEAPVLSVDPAREEPVAEISAR
ncbi:MAG: NADH-quinone oxidoreductase subunit N [Phycisphaerales bacterium]